MDIRRGDTVKILAGKDKGKQGTVEKVIKKDEKVVITGLNISKRHTKPNSKYPSGGIVEVSYPIHQSNVSVVDTERDTKTKKSSRVTTK